MHGHTSTKLARMFVAAGAILAACSEAPTNPTAPVAPPSFAVLGTDFDAPQEPVLGKILVCKTDASNVSGTFTISLNSGSGTFQASATVNPGRCVEVANDFTTVVGVFSSFGISENAAPANTTQAYVACSKRDDVEGTISVTNCFGVQNEDPVLINNFHGYVLTYENIFTPVDICTYTKGWYQNKNGAPTIVTTIDGRSPNDQRAIFEASPGQPGNVTWGVGTLTNNKPNNLLNLYQQFLAAMNNLGGDEDAGPDAVDDAIDAVQAATGGSGLYISVVAGTDISALINTLSAFNEGRFRGFPHCDDEVLTD